MHDRRFHLLGNSALISSVVCILNVVILLRTDKNDLAMIFAAHAGTSNNSRMMRQVRLVVLLMIIIMMIMILESR